MDAAELRAMQAPIKDKYKTDAGAALITLRAKGTLDDQNIACKVETGRALAVAGLGGWNSMRTRRRLGTPDGTRNLRRYAAMELALAALVLAVTTVLVSTELPHEMSP